MAILTLATLVKALTFRTTGRDTDLEQVKIQLNNLTKTVAQLSLPFTSDGVLKGTALSRGTTVTLASSQCVITIAGVPVSVAATTAQALGALGTIPASTWGIIGVDAVAAGTLTFVSGAANYTTGYTTEALAIAAIPAKTASKARIGHVLILASASTFVVGTDALAGGTGGNPATTTNYYNIASPWDLTADSANAIALGSVAWTTKLLASQGGVVAVTSTDP